jgi:hypothetical protein
MVSGAAGCVCARSVDCITERGDPPHLVYFGAMERARKPGSFEGVATSKFAVPRRRDDVIRRTRLNAFVDAAIGGKGMLIAAPAGYGKTTLVVDWLSTADFAAVWGPRRLASELPLRPRRRRRDPPAVDADVPLETNASGRAPSPLCSSMPSQSTTTTSSSSSMTSTGRSSDDVMTTLGYLMSALKTLVISDLTHAPCHPRSRD